MATLEERAYLEQIGLGKTPEFAKAYASKISEGEIFARHFAIIRERRALAKKRAAVEAGADSGPVPSEKPVAEPAKKSEEAQQLLKRSAQDFVIHRVLGEGSFSTVFLATEKSTEEQYAIKIVDKMHLKKHNKVKTVMIEKEVFNTLDHPLIVKLRYTFQDPEKLYFVLGYCKNGELLHWIRKVDCFDEASTRFYSAEIISAIKHMHDKGVIHRDLKPENILLDADMHVKLTDFGTAKVLKDDDDRAASFVGTAQYVSPELLVKKQAFKSSDLWAIGCIVYQLLSGKVPFRGANDYKVFEAIKALDYSFPEGFAADARDLVSKLLVLEPSERIGCKERGGFDALMQHPFYKGIEWGTLPQQTPPKLDAFLPAMNPEDKPLHGNDAADDELADIQAAVYMQKAESQRIKPPTQESERKALLDKQASESRWHKYCKDSELIIKTGLVDKRKGLFAKRRQLILTDAPRMIYIDPETDEQKGEIPWSSDLFPQFKNMKTFFVHTPLRTYYLEDVERTSITWVDTIQQLLRMQKSKS